MMVLLLREGLSGTGVKANHLAVAGQTHSQFWRQTSLFFRTHNRCYEDSKKLRSKAWTGRSFIQPTIPALTTCWQDLVVHSKHLSRNLCPGTHSLLNRKPCEASLQRTAWRREGSYEGKSSRPAFHLTGVLLRGPAICQGHH